MKERGSRGKDRRKGQRRKDRGKEGKGRKIEGKGKGGRLKERQTKKTGWNGSPAARKVDGTPMQINCFQPAIGGFDSEDEKIVEKIP